MNPVLRGLKKELWYSSKYYFKLQNNNQKNVSNN